MKTNKQNPDFLNIGTKIIDWYDENARELPWRSTQNPYKIWISEVILQQTQVQQGRAYYLRFIERFPDVKTLAEADTDEVLLYWKGLGYYSRALNLHEAGQQIMRDFNGEFPSTYQEILSLKGIGKYTAAAIVSICFGEAYPAVDGNFYRVFSRLFADDFDISKSNAFQYFSALADRVMPPHRPGDFNQAIMDLGSEVCKPKTPQCGLCPVSEDCMAYQTGRALEFPVKHKKVSVTTMNLTYYMIHCQGYFLIKKRNRASIWKNLYEFPTQIPEAWQPFIRETKVVNHKLTHRNLIIEMNEVPTKTLQELHAYAQQHGYDVVNPEMAAQKSFPKPLEQWLKDFFV
ncbi:A/G-specific adenine glycosylase [Riemerella columbina]|uniref:A/G-specific adenine glycosylase n=1 Tax=Riemerella columbina TaxID=103810 RepID=UPI00266F0F4D|nr:A/G-specific adenine glycosylase [Riemerella columbina]WKS94795.1 A/G-specific adenine glycosylase [Riemerella columbina]